MSDYLRRLKHHPGVPVASFFTVIGSVMGAEDGLTGALLGAAVMSLVFWPIVLWTAHTQPLPAEDDINE